MAAAIDLGGKIKLAINGAYERGFPVAVAYVDEAGKPSVSLRSSVQVLTATEIGLWARKADSGLAKAIETHPDMALLFFGHLPDGSRMRMELKGRARVDRTRNAEVYDGMGAVERNYDPDAKGIAVIIEIESVAGMTADGPFQQGCLIPLHI